MATLEYPVALTKKNWDKKKPAIAKTKSTGIGAALAALQKKHDAVAWKNMAFSDSSSVADLEKQLQAAMKEYNSKVTPLAKEAASVSKLASDWEGKFSKDKLMPKSAAKEAKAIASAADSYAKAVQSFDEEITKEFKAARAASLAKLSKMLTPIIQSQIKKTDIFLKDIEAFKAKPSMDTLLKLATGDGGARGYCTACKFWDTSMAKMAPDIRDRIYKGKAMDTLFPPVKEYGANRSSADWEKMIADLESSKGISREQALDVHVKHLQKQVPNIKKFQGMLQQVVNELK